MTQNRQIQFYETGAFYTVLRNVKNYCRARNDQAKYRCIKLGKNLLEVDLNEPALEKILAQVPRKTFKLAG